MKEKLRDLLESEGLKPGQFAEMVGINPAGVSHILAGRNKPGFELLQKILRRFPRVSPDWLLIDEGPMYRSSETSSTTATTQMPIDRPNATQQMTPASSSNLFDPSPDTLSHSTATKEMIAKCGTSKGKATRIVIFYEDQTFESFTPSHEPTTHNNTL